MCPGNIPDLNHWSRVVGARARSSGCMCSQRHRCAADRMHWLACGIDCRTHGWQPESAIVAAPWAHTRNDCRWGEVVLRLRMVLCRVSAGACVPPSTRLCANLLHLQLAVRATPTHCRDSRGTLWVGDVCRPQQAQLQRVHAATLEWCIEESWQHDDPHHVDRQHVSSPSPPHTAARRRTRWPRADRNSRTGTTQPRSSQMRATPSGSLHLHHSRTTSLRAKGKSGPSCARESTLLYRHPVFLEPPSDPARCSPPRVPNCTQLASLRCCLEPGGCCHSHPCHGHLACTTRPRVWHAHAHAGSP